MSDDEHLTPGQLALREAARLEAARFYGAVLGTSSQPASITAAVAEAEVEAAIKQATVDRAVRKYVRDGGQAVDDTELMVG